MMERGALRSTLRGIGIVAGREIRDQIRDWRIITPIILLTLFFPLLMNITAQQAVGFVARYGAPIIGDRLIPFLLLVVGFFPISISLVIALESFAGERERLSLEPLLATPLRDSQLYFGKMFASMVPPLTAAYLGIVVYLVGLYLSIGWQPPLQLLLQIFILTTVQALVMVSGAVVISSLTTSVRAANLLASFVVIPVAELIIIESMVMFWARYNVLWWIVAGLILIAVVLARMGLHLFNREELLSREIDVLNFRWAVRHFWEAFRGGAENFGQWYSGVLRMTLPALFVPVVMQAGVLIAGYFLGYRLAETFTLPPDLFVWDGVGGQMEEYLEAFNLTGTLGILQILYINVRSIGLSTLLGAFTFGVLGIIMLMLPFSIIGYFAGNTALAGGDVGRFLLAFILPHGSLEIPAAVLAGAAILQLGSAALRLPAGSTLGEGWLTALAGWARIITAIVIPLLIGSAALEVIVTPRVVIALFGG